jgi:SAM-dependent methyltransferase
VGPWSKREHPLARWHNILIYLLVDKEIRRRLERFASGRMVDVGCGTKPYRELAASHVTEHVGVDLPDGRHGQAGVDVFASAYETGLDDASFDTLLCTDVLEHLEEPQRAVDEAFRLLRPGGHGIYTVPFFWHLHEEPRDFYRYTEHGLAHLFRRAGFEVIEITALSGFVATFTQELIYVLADLRRGGRLNPLWWVVPPLGLALQGLAYLVNRVGDGKYSLEYIAVVRKPAA